MQPHSRASPRPLVWSIRLQLQEGKLCLNHAKRATDDRTTAGHRQPRSKRAAILETATELFGREGYEDSKWADVAESVGIGSTALYHYFESKLHCLYEIMAEALEAEVERFDRITSEHEEFEDALVAVLKEAFDLSEHEILRNRLLVSEQVLVGCTGRPHARRRRVSWRASAPVTSSSSGPRS